MSTPKKTKAGRELRKKLSPERPFTQKSLSDALGVTQQTISAWMHGRARPEGDERRALIAKLTGIPAAEWDEEISDADESGGRSIPTDEDIARAAEG